MNIIGAENLFFSYSKEKGFLSDLNINFQEEDFISIIGRNGSGKSTLIKLLSGVYRPDAGRILLRNKNILQYKIKELAQIVSYLPQYGLPLYEDIMVKDFLLMGRYPTKNFFDFVNTKYDEELLEYSSETTGIKNLLLKSLSELSGGERQKVLITLSLVQLDILNNLKNKVLIVDEPLTYLDVSHQFEVFNLLRGLNDKKGLTVIIVTHDLNLSLKFSKKTLVLDKGSIVNYGNTNEVLKTELIEKYFMVKSKIMEFQNNQQIFYIN